MNQLALDNNFGQMSIDLESVNAALTSIGDDLDKKFEKLTQFREESEKAAKEYKQAGQKVIESMWSDMVTGKELTEKDQKAIDSQAEKVMVAMKTSIAKAAQEKLEFASQLFANEDGSVSEGDVSSLPLFASITSLVEYGMQDAIAKAQSMSADLRSAITNAFADKKLTEEEMQNIQSIISQMNELIDSYGSSDITEEMLLNKSQRVSLESLEDFTEQVKAAKDKAFAETDDQMDYMEAWLRKAYNAAVKNGVKVFDPVSEGWVDPNEVNIDDLIASTHEMYTGKRTEWGSAFDEILRRGHQNALATTDTGALFTEAQYYISKAQEGLISFSEANELIANSASGNQQLLRDSMQYTIDYFGGIGEMADLVRQYRGKSDAQSQKMADWLEQIILIQEALGGSQIGADLSDLQPDTQKSNQQMMDYLSEIYKTGEGEEAMMAYFNSMNDAQKKAWNNAVDALEKQYDLKDLGTSYAPYSVFAEGGKTLGDDTLRWLGAYVAGNLSLRNPEVRENLVDYQQPAAGQPTFGGIPVAQITPYAEGFDQLDAIDDMLESQGALKIPIDANTDKLETAIKAEDLKTLMAYVDGDASGLQVAIMSEDGKTLKQYVTGDASQLDSIIKEHQGETLRLSISGIPHFGPEQPEGEQPLFGGVPVAKIAPYTGEQNPLESLSNQLESQGAIEVQVDGETSELQTAIKAEDLKTLMEYVDGDASQLDVKIMSEDGKTLLEHVTGDASQLDTLINSYQGRTIRLNITGLGFFAEGGRAVEPSIFGEAGPEWAIPEEHSLRTANLLNAAREASGFTWGELLERNGGLNAGGDINVSISSYAPVINANDVTGVADELTKDKARLGEVVRKAVKSALDDMNMKNGIEVYA
jgi:ketosteroid isomerase-like protein